MLYRTIQIPFEKRKVYFKPEFGQIDLQLLKMHELKNVETI